MAFLVTGAAGFIGYHLCQTLLTRGEEVVGIDNLNNYYDVELKKARLARLEGKPGFSFHHLDISDSEAMKTFAAAHSDITHITNLAAQAGVRHSLSHPRDYVTANLIGFLEVLELARHLPNLKHLAYASSSSVYGANTKLPFSVDDRVDRPVSLYAASKKANEMMAHAYSHLYGIPTTGLRFFTVYGPWGRPDMAAYIFTKAIMAGEPIEVFNNGDMHRDFTYIDDIVSGVVACLDHPPQPNHGAPHRVYNIGNHHSENLMDFIAILESACGRKAEIKFGPMQPGDVKDTYADIEATTRDFGFHPSTPIAVGLPKFVNWFDMTKNPVISVIGMGYVGLPLAVALAGHFDVVGFDIGKSRIAELKTGYDRTNELESERLKASTLKLTDIAADMKNSDVFIVAVPTPVDYRNEPDLSQVMSACRTLGSVIGKGATIVIESTVYPGVTEDLCGPALEHASGLTCGVDFFLGYSPERINPGDREHTVDKITKVIAGQTPPVTELLAEIYGKVTSGDVFLAASIKAAEAAKVIENAQRDINIAFINEVTIIFNRLGLSVHDVLDASATKWNFLPFRPGLVGGHCIGVDPYYLVRCAIDNGYTPKIILSGRHVNDHMGQYIADGIADRLSQEARVLVLGLTFKENVPDLRNSKVIDVVYGLRRRGLHVDVYDGLADATEANHEYGIVLTACIAEARGYDALVGAVAHDAYANFGADEFSRLVKQGGLVADIKGMWRKTILPVGMERWSL